MSQDVWEKQSTKRPVPNTKYQLEDLCTTDKSVQYWEGMPSAPNAHLSRSLHNYGQPEHSVWHSQQVPKDIFIANIDEIMKLKFEESLLLDLMG